MVNWVQQVMNILKDQISGDGDKLRESCESGNIEDML